MKREEVFEKRLIVIDKYDNHEQMGWFYGGFEIIIRLTWASATVSNAYTYLLSNNELVALGKFIAELEDAGVEIIKIETFDPTSNKGYEEIEKENIYSYRKAKGEMR